ncbi:heavy metal-associated domain-containing protein [Thermomonas sp.]|uniref:cation transporter n=1 Tax=Thermomonas sp. TaxID=1971895 RepID=UPI0024878089|nr:heavy metal-associated domain-containing protein [Thermomonas sp.]MDI1251547.1 heavy metal-associated domain-containing protein [Thermomonas sp.]
MRTSIIEVGGMLSALSARGVEKQLMKLPGIEKAEVNYVCGSATAIYDERLIGLKEIQARVQQCGYRCSGALQPKHVCQMGANRGTF